jgi:3-hydroxy-9,10-secoandrosta-1,3,5(10)-triene-9,17-dione monooxygenase reductase component
VPVSADDFRHALGRFASGVTVVTTAVDGKLGGLTVSAFSSVSLDPPYILICIDKRSSVIPLLRTSRVYGVNILSSDQSDVSNHFASRREDKFAGVSYRIGTLGVPVLEGVLAHLECKVTQEVDGGDHFIYIGQVEHSSVDESKEPLLYFHGKYRELAK